MDGMTLLTTARAASLDVHAEGDRLVIHGPKRGEALAQALIARKAEVLRLLRAEGQDDPPPPATRQAEGKPPEIDDPYARLEGPWRTEWGSWAYSDPDAIELEAFG